MTAAAGHGEELQLVRRHAEHLREWLTRNVAWSLTVEPEGVRLRKIPGTTSDTSRPAVDATSAQPFTKRRYAIMCLALAVLERSERQTVLGKLAEEVGKLHAAEPAFTAAGMGFDLATQDCRKDLVHAVRLLLSLGILVRVQGDEQQFVHSQGDVLYDIDRRALAFVLSAQKPPSMVAGQTLEERLDDLIEEPTADSPEAHNRRLRVGLTRRLLDDPVLYFDELPEEQRGYLASTRAHLSRQIEEATGLHAEVRREGMAFVDEGGRLTDLGLPEEGTEGHLALLLAEHLAKKERAQPGAAIPVPALVAHVAKLSREYGAHWRKDARVAGSEERLTEETLRRLQALRLVTLTPEGVYPRPAIGRYALRTVR
jgi:uncharacterized protein (TIGR02678 family)